MCLVAALMLLQLVTPLNMRAEGEAPASFPLSHAHLREQLRGRPRGRFPAGQQNQNRFVNWQGTRLLTVLLPRGSRPCEHHLGPGVKRSQHCPVLHLLIHLGVGKALEDPVKAAGSSLR